MLRPPFDHPPTLVFLNKRYMPVPPRPKQRSHCKRGHKLTGSNVYQENASSPRRCWTCRRASWRKYQYRKATAVRGATAPDVADQFEEVA
jgi:hypothetical protein